MTDIKALLKRYPQQGVSGVRHLRKAKVRKIVDNEQPTIADLLAEKLADKFADENKDGYVIYLRQAEEECKEQVEKWQKEEVVENATP